jgi:hypothetical protein
MLTPDVELLSSRTGRVNFFHLCPSLWNDVRAVWDTNASVTSTLLLQPGSLLLPFFHFGWLIVGIHLDLCADSSTPSPRYSREPVFATESFPSEFVPSAFPGRMHKWLTGQGAAEPHPMQWRASL